MPGKEKPKKPPKYRNKKTVYNGDLYDSQKEAARAWELDQLQKAGAILYHWPQLPVELPGGIVYKMDFLVLYPDGHFEVEDVKSPATRKDKAYRQKYRLMQSMGLKIKEV
jgi:hypothetical protein